MTYEEFVATRAERQAKSKAMIRCYGCRVPFERIGMRVEDATIIDGEKYCSSDCHCETENAINEAEYFNGLRD